MKEIIKAFKALSEPTRLRIFLLLMERDLCVCELTFVLDMEQSRVSHQLRLLRDADLVEDKREGRWIIYGIPEGVKERPRAVRPAVRRSRTGRIGIRASGYRAARRVRQGKRPEETQSGDTAIRGLKSGIGQDGRNQASA
ncbi:MAG: metalloregulator ArsR/SmtB family transcription factor [Candidatus Moduliflexus flocculans]|nr:metalloregulator ArsR/SmtB family transcription factor [Candidatus Moduliflexus flocculans]